MPFSFRFRLIPFIAALAVAVIGVMLGNWQQGRAEEKTALQARQQARAAEPTLVLGPTLTAAAPLEFRKVSLTGEWVAGWPVFLTNRPMKGQSGFYLAMPFKIAGSSTHVLVLRGWLPRQAEAGKVPVFATPSGIVTVQGQVVATAGRVMELGQQDKLAPGAFVQNLAPQELAAASGMQLQPFLVQQLAPSAPGDEMVRDWPQPAAGIDKHRGYAFQWYALAAVAILFFVLTGFRRGSNNRK